MNTEDLRALLADVASSNLDIEQAVTRLRRLPFESLGFATVDHHRAVRCGFGEVIFCPGKQTAHVVAIARRLSAHGGPVLATRANSEQLGAIRNAFPNAVISEAGRIALVNAPPEASASDASDGSPFVALICAGTADLPVFEESAMTFRSTRTPIRKLTDVGVSGLHRLLHQLDVLQGACAVVVIAGMEGALPSVVGGLVDCPVYAVPTSVGYGASFGGLSALLGMLNSCASNISVVNIDNGFGAAYNASLVYQQVARQMKRATAR